VCLGTIAVVAMVSVGCAHWSGEERAIKRRLSAIAERMTVPANESEMSRVARVAGLGNYLSPNLRVRYDKQEATRDAVLGALAQWGRSADGVTVEFVDVQVALDDSLPDLATAHLAAKITTRDSVDAREADVTLARENGEWVVTTAETRETLTR
jgi:hypothetical protein